MILTNDEKRTALEWAYSQTKKHRAWVLAQWGASEGKINASVDNVQVDEEKVIHEANLRKHWKIEEDKAKAEKIKEDQAAAIKEESRLASLDAKYFYRLLKWNVHQDGKTLLINDSTGPYIKAICFFMSEDPRFETELKLSLKKGLWIRGVSGLGKTFILQNISNNHRAVILIKNMIEIMEEIRLTGEFKITQPFGKFMIDDLATEQNSVVKHYGTDINWGKDFIERYYLHPDKYNQLIITTNAGFDEIERRYGFRVRSRLKDMFNVIDVSGIDMRG